MDGANTFYFSSSDLEATQGCYTILRKHLSVEHPLAVISPHAEHCWVGFGSIAEAVSFKHRNHLGDSWRIRDRRTILACEEENELCEAMLNIGSMISDHIRLLTAAVFASGRMPASVRREITMFAHTVIRECIITSDRDIGKWRPMRGKFLHNGMEVSHCWLEDRLGNVIDFLPWNYPLSPASYACHQDGFVKNYLGVSVLSDGYGTEFGSYLRGEKAHEGASLTAAEFRKRYLTLGDHIASYLSRSRLPALN